jgi:PAS domain S-box-containing protein
MSLPANTLTPAKLKSAIVRNPLIVTPDTTVMDAIAQMSGVRSVCAVSQDNDQSEDHILLEARSSCVVVVENHQPIGIFTERDVVRLSAQRRDLHSLSIANVMKTAIISLRESEFTDIFFAVNLMQHHHIRHLPVIDEQDKLVGLLTHESLQKTSQPIDLLRVRLVNEVMTRNVICAAPHNSILAIARLMAENRVSSVMIVQTQESLTIPVGIVTERDIVQFQALNLNFEDCTAEAVMSTPVFCVNDHDSLLAVQQIMEQRLIQRLAVTGTQGELLGIVTQSSILQILNPLELYKLTEVLEQKVSQLEAEKIGILENRTIELEQQVDSRTLELTKKAEREHLITTVASQIRSSLNLQTILDTAVTKIHELLKCDRVIIYQFHPDLSGKVIAESLNPGSLSILHNESQDPCINTECLEPYRQGKIQRINDIYTESITPCHQQMIIDMGIRAKLMAGIVVENQLWGLLLGSYRDISHLWETDEIELIKLLSIQLAIAIKQGNAHEQLQIELRQRQQAESELYQLNQQLEARVQERTAELFNLSQRLDLAVKSAEIGIWEWDIVNNRFIWDDRMCEIYGIHPSEFTDGMEIWQARLHPQDATKAHAEFQKALKGEKDFDPEFRIVLPDGTVRFIEVFASIQTNSQGQAERMIGINLDITERKQTEAQLQNLSNRLQTAVKAAQIGIWDWDMLNNRTLWDERMCEIYGINPSEFTDGMEIWQAALHPDDVQKTQEILSKILETHQEIECEFRIILPDGKIRFIQSYGLIQKNSQGIAERMIGVNIDITEQKKAEQKIQQQAERERLLRLTSERIRQPLDLTRIFNTAAEEIRQLINADRVAIFQFAPDSFYNDGEVVSESVVNGFPSALATKVHDHCFGEQYAAYYQQGRMQVVADIDNAGLSDCHRQILAQFQVKANLVAPLLQENNLWGLLCIHQCSQPRQWKDFEVELVQQVAEQLALAIQQSSLYEQVQSELIIRKKAEQELSLQLQRLKTIQEITQAIRSSLNLNHILATVTQKVYELMQADRVIVFRLFADGKSQIVEEVVSSNYAALKYLHWEDETWSQDILELYWQGKPRIVPDVMNDIWTDCLVEYSQEGNIKSKIVAPILQELGDNETGRWANVPHNKLWGILVVHACSKNRIWEESEAEVLQQIANQLSLAIQQSDLFYQLQTSLAKEKEISAMRSRFITMASHEFRTPLAIIGSSTGILQNFIDRLTPEKRQGHLETIQKTIKHIIQLLDDVLMINRAEAEKLEFKPETKDIIGFCNHLKQEIEITSSKHRIEFVVNANALILESNTLVVQFDPKLIRQILTNLLSNAVKYSPENSVVYFSLTVETNQLIFKIKDSGIGIPKKDQQNLFASFYRASNVGNISGTGLGLVIVKKCVDMHQGKISLDSEPGKGTTFTVSIPHK